MNILVLVAAAVGTAVWAVLDARTRVDSDVFLFAGAGSKLLSGSWLHAYHDSTVQAGPLELALSSLARTAGGGRAGMAVVLDVGCTLAVLATAAWLLRGHTAGLVAVVAGAFAVQLPLEGLGGHPAALLVPVLWMLAARQARAGRVAVAGVLVGLSGCLELWGMLGVAVLALAPLSRRSVGGALASVGIPVASLLPFALGGDFHMLDYHWRAVAGLSALLLRGGEFTWYDRIVQGALVVTSGALLARKLRTVPDSIWVVPAIVLLLRIALDPVTNQYYWDGPLIVLLIGGASVIARRHELELRLASLVR
jgi:hypothetical protein